MDKVTGLLDGFRALDLTDEKGFLCGRLLGDLGVDVIKVEPPGGDPARRVGPFFHDTSDPEKSLLWFAYNANKRGITINIERADGRKLFNRLVKTADFVIESSPPSYMDRLGLGFSALSEINPGIIMTSISPFGQTGPYSAYKASDITCMAMGGLMYICGDEDRPPVRFSVEQSYLQGGAQACVGTLMALYHRLRTGEGQHVDISIQECIVWTLDYTLPYWDTGRRLVKRTGIYQKRMDKTWLRAFPCKDGYIAGMVGGGLTTGPMQARLVAAMDHEGMADDLKDMDWKSTSLDAVTQETINHWEEAMVKYFMTHTKAEIQAEAIKSEILFCPSNNIKEVADYPQLAARDYWQEVEHPELSTNITYPGFLFKSSETSSKMRRRAPLIGEHNQELYGEELGISGEELALLKKEGVI